jgi:hypothetical protein
MFDSKQNLTRHKQSLTRRIADAVDLAIDFATLGEYGLEPVERTAASCESRSRQSTLAAPRSRTADRGHGIVTRSR